jgi:hypothetical protein
MAEVARSAHQLPSKIERQPQTAVGHVEVQFLDVPPRRWSIAK